MILFGGVTGGGTASNLEAAAYDPDTDTWRSLADLPYPTERNASSAWSGQHAYLWPDPEFGNRAEPPLIYDPVTNAWASLPPPPATGSPISPSIVWTGTELIAWGVNQSGPEDVGVGLRYQPESEQWITLPPAPIPSSDGYEGAPGSQAAVWTGNDMIVGRDGSERLGKTIPPASSAMRPPRTHGANWNQHRSRWSGCTKNR